MENSKVDHFEVFISYRRKTGAQDARTLYYALKSIGIRAFFDYNSIRNGKFNEAIYDAIDKADCFILLLTPGSLDRCVQDEKDWVRKEIEYAITHQKIIIPVSPTNQRVISVLPPELPPLMEEALRDLQISRLDTEDLFPESLFKIISDRFPKAVCDRHPNLLEEIKPEKLPSDDVYTNDTENASGEELDVNLVFRLRLWNAIDAFKVSVFEYLVKDFLADLHNGGNIQVKRQAQASKRLMDLLGESRCYLNEDEFQQVYDLCDNYLAKSYNDFFGYVRALQAANKGTTVSDLLQFVSSRMNDDFFKHYNAVKEMLVGSTDA